jgi:hypothetical protein
MACEVASALVFLHSAPEPIIHMDLKPGGGVACVSAELRSSVCEGGGGQLCVMTTYLV